MTMSLKTAKLQDLSAETQEILREIDTLLRLAEDKNTPTEQQRDYILQAESLYRSVCVWSSEEQPT